jgi:hypothetical protein
LIFIFVVCALGGPADFSASTGRNMNRFLRTSLVFIAIVLLIFGLGYAFRLPFATSFWPYSYTGAMSYIFIGSLAAAASAAILWCVWEREDGALSGIGISIMAVFFPLGIFILQAAQGNSNQMLFGVAVILGGVFGIVLFLHTFRIPITPNPPLPGLVRIAFVIFILALIIVGGQMVLRRPDVLPWEMTATGSVIYGWAFLGASTYFAYALARPSWHNAGGQLAGFLAYDLVLILPFLQRLPSMQPEFLLNQLIYTGVVVLSGALAIYYLFIKRETRLSRAKQAAPSSITLNTTAPQASP